MKLFRLMILLIALSMAFVSCNKDEDELVSGNKFESTYMKMEITGSMTLSIEYKTKAELEKENIYSIIEFKSDGNFYADNVLEGSWTQNESTVVITSDGERITGTISGNVLTLSSTETEGGNVSKITMQFTKI